MAAQIPLRFSRPSTSPGPSYRKQISSTAYSLHSSHHHCILHLWGTRGCDTACTAPTNPQEEEEEKSNDEVGAAACLISLDVRVGVRINESFSNPHNPIV
ncbi:hypothetical protein E2C01_006911 [Portunus trituberculatus]|uniref:Uncharacterized protein n=1 Tax=Portunus trituberculatus TaxID=210409 RepID=A0A5B7D329_PORTR|nr:hypothetical protein [Portunus trituberculatus]